jgi:diguanylate cyclase (GGDEF)-like protein
MVSTARRERFFIAVASLAILGVGASLLHAHRSEAGNLILALLILAAVSLYAWGDWRGWFDITTNESSEAAQSVAFPLWQAHRAAIVIAGLFLLSLGYVALTGGFISPFFCLLYLPLLLLTIRFGVARGLAVSFMLAAVYLVAAQRGSQMRVDWLEAVSLTFPLAALFGAVFSARLETGFRRIASREAEMQTLMDVSRMLETALDLETTINLILMNAIRLVECSACAVYLCDNEDTLTLRGSVGPASGDLKETVAIGKLSLEGWRLGDDKILSVSRGAGVLEMNSDLGSSLLATLRGTDRVLGLLYVSREDPARLFDESEQARVGRLAVHIGLPLQQACYRDSLELMAFNDPMTGLANFRYFQRRLADELARAQRHARPLSVLMLDIDHFKSFNDTWGHGAGDILLGEVGALLKETVREGDLPARYGGEEFVILCPEARGEDTAVVAERVRAAVERAKFRLPESQGGVSTEVSISVSVGFATFPDDVSLGEEVVTAADQALYEAKRSGRNCIRGVSALKRLQEDQPRERAAAS